MKFGIVLPVGLDGAAGGMYEGTLRVAQLAEEIGYDFATVSHHRWTPRYPSAPLVLLAAIAARTSTLRLGTNIVMLPTRDPLEIAEEVATLDRISGGRVYIGAGVGYRREEFEPSGVRFEDRGVRMTEALQILRRVWTEEDVSFDGDHFRFEHVNVYPRPVQQPSPPLFVGAQMPRTVERAARLGDGWTTDSKTTLRELEPLVRIFRDTAAADADPRPRQISVTRDVGIGRSRAEVEQHWLPSVMEVFAEYWRAGMRFPDEKNLSERLAHGERVGFDEFTEDRFVAGSPDDCIAAIERVEAVTGCDQLLIRAGYGTTFDEDALQLFAREVLPHFH